MSELLEPSFPVCDPETVTPAELADFVYASFRFSQEDDDLQGNLFSYGRHYYHSVLRDADGIVDEVEQRVARRAQKWVAHGPHPNVEEPREDLVESMAKTYTTKFMRPKDIDTAYVTRTIDVELDRDTAARIILRDARWLVNKVGGRPNRGQNSGGEQADPFLSHGLYYGLLGNTTHRVPYDAMFQRVGSAILDLYTGIATPDTQLFRTHNPQLPLIRNRLWEVIHAYSEHHPDDVAALQATLPLPPRR